MFSNVTDGTQIDGLQVNISAAIPEWRQVRAAPVGNAASSMKRLLDKPPAWPLPRL